MGIFVLKPHELHSICRQMFSPPSVSPCRNTQMVYKILRNCCIRSLRNKQENLWNCLQRQSSEESMWFTADGDGRGCLSRQMYGLVLFFLRNTLRGKFQLLLCKALLLIFLYISKQPPCLFKIRFKRETEGLAGAHFCCYTSQDDRGESRSYYIIKAREQDPWAEPGAGSLQACSKEGPKGPLKFCHADLHIHSLEGCNTSLTPAADHRSQ